jgi:Restriction endonuclease
MLGVTMLKQCTQCRRWKLRSEFHKREESPDGLKPICKECRKSVEKSYNTEYHQNHKEEFRERNRNWRLNNKEKADEWMLAYRAENKDKVSEWNRRYRAAHPEKVQEYTHNRYARKKSNGGNVTAEQWEMLKQEYNYTCLQCGQQEPEIKLTMDHVLPLKLGGKHEIENIQPLCGNCNSSKQDKHIDYR